MRETSRFLNYDLMTRFEINQFRANRPFPWFNFSQFLTPSGFEELRRDFPSIELFEQHCGLARPHGQRPHNRYYLAYTAHCPLENFASCTDIDSVFDGLTMRRTCLLPSTWQRV